MSFSGFGLANNPVNSTGANASTTLNSAFATGSLTSPSPLFSSTTTPFGGTRNQPTGLFGSAAPSTANPPDQKNIPTFSVKIHRRLDGHPRKEPKLLKGPAIEIIVGSEIPSSEKTDQRETWWLPKNLVSACSETLNAACNRDFKEKEENCILLVEDDPEIFSLYVEWLYYDTYTIPSKYPQGTRSMTDAEAWVLGDKLLSKDFKNYAMSRIYQHYLRFDGFSMKPVLLDDISYVLENTSENSGLREFFIDYVCANFSKTTVVIGSTSDWDDVLLAHDDARKRMFDSIRNPVSIKPLDQYNEKP